MASSAFEPPAFPEIAPLTWIPPSVFFYAALVVAVATALKSYTDLFFACAEKFPRVRAPCRAGVGPTGRALGGQTKRRRNTHPTGAFMRARTHVMNVHAASLHCSAVAAVGAGRRVQPLGITLPSVPTTHSDGPVPGPAF